jgi:hypothetical protein
MTNYFTAGLTFELPGENGEQGELMVNVCLSHGPLPGQYRLEQALFSSSWPYHIDEDTVRLDHWSPPATYHDLIEADERPDSQMSTRELIFRRLIGPAPGRRYEYTFEHEYLRRGMLSSPEAAALRQKVEGIGVYWQDALGHAVDRLFIYVPPGISYDPTEDVGALPPFEADY